jgi:hypothetical protein
MMIEVYEKVVESGEMQDVFEKGPEITARMEVCEKVLDIAIRMEVSEKALNTRHMVGKFMEVEGVYSRPFPILGSP